MREEILLEVRNLCFSYEGRNNALEHINLTIRAGERIAVLGANGAGKSTFFLNLNGVRQPDSGEIFFRGEKIGKRERRLLARQVGIVFQDADHQMIASTVKAEVAFGPVNMRLSREEVQRRTEGALEEMNLTKLADRPPHYLSGGEKKRVSIADILAMEPEVIIFDEPTASLDPVNTQMLEETLERLREKGKTILLSTHDADFAFRFAERVLVFHQGRLMEDGAPEDIFNKKELLKRTNLKRPMLMEVTDLLAEKGVISGRKAYPRDLEAFAGLLESR